MSKLNSYIPSKVQALVKTVLWWFQSSLYMIQNHMIKKSISQSEKKKLWVSSLCMPLFCRQVEFCFPSTFTSSPRHHRQQKCDNHLLSKWTESLSGTIYMYKTINGPTQPHWIHLTWWHSVILIYESDFMYSIRITYVFCHSFCVALTLMMKLSYFLLNSYNYL